MPIMINRGKEMLRISPKDSKKIEYSANQGRSWIVRYSVHRTQAHSAT